jgi:hypothetical protein
MSGWTDETITTALDGDDANVALEAAEAVAAAAGFPGDALAPDGREWAETHGVPPDDLIERALRRVRDLCASETDDATLTELRDLRYRLGDAIAR